MQTACVASLLLLLCVHNVFSDSGLQTFFVMQQRVWIRQSDLTTLLLAAGTPKCLQPCIKDLVSASNAAFKSNSSIVTGIEKLCKQYKEAKKCVASSVCKDSSIFNIFTKGLEAACGRNFHLIYFVKPCLNRFAGNVLDECDANCDLTMAFEQLTQNQQVQKLVAQGGNALKLLQHLGPTCSSVTCFLSCAHKRLNSKCPVTGSAFVEVSIKPMEDVARKLKSGSAGLKNMVKKKIPVECQPLLDIDYLNNLKAFGTLPNKKPV